MAKKSLETVVAFILDKSGSMSSVADATRSGFNEYVQTLKQDKKSRYSFSLTLFNEQVEKRYTNVPIGDVAAMDTETYVPSGMTALYDAAMKTINETAASVKENQKVLCVIMTDGQENSSVEYKEGHLKEKIKELEAKGNWSFVFLGANQDAWATAQQFGMSMNNVATFTASSAGVNNTFKTVARNTGTFAMSANSTTADFFSGEDKDNLLNS